MTPEHNPDNLTPEQYGAPEWRLLNTSERVLAGDEYWGDKWFPSVVGNLSPLAHQTQFAYRRRVEPAPSELESLRAEVERLNNQLVVISAIVAETLPKEPENFIHQVESYAAERLQEQRELARLRAELEQWKKWGDYASKRFTEETGKDLQAQSA